MPQPQQMLAIQKLHEHLASLTQANQSNTDYSDLVKAELAKIANHHIFVTVETIEEYIDYISKGDETQNLSDKEQSVLSNNFMSVMIFRESVTELYKAAPSKFAHLAGDSAKAFADNFIAEWFNNIDVANLTTAHAALVKVYDEFGAPTDEKHQFSGKMQDLLNEFFQSNLATHLYNTKNDSKNALEDFLTTQLTEPVYTEHSVASNLMFLNNDLWAIYEETYNTLKTNLWTRKVTENLNSWDFWGGIQSAKLNPKSVQVTLLAAQENVYSYAVNTIMQYGNNMMVVSKDSATKNITAFDQEFSILPTSITIQQSDLEGELQVIIKTLLEAGGDNTVIYPAKYKTKDAFLTALVEVGLLSTKDINDVTEPSMRQTVTEFTKAFHNAHLNAFQDELIKKVKVGNSASEDEFNEKAIEAVNYLRTMDIFDETYMLTVFEHWSKTYCPSVVADDAKTTYTKAIKKSWTEASKLKRGSAIVEFVNKLKTIINYLSDGTDKVKNTAERSESAVVAASKGFAGSFSSFGKALSSLQDLSSLGMDFIGVASTIRYTQLATFSWKEYKAFDTEWAANRTKIELAAKELDGELTKIGQGQGNPEKAQELQDQKSRLDSRDFYLHYAIGKKFRQFLEFIVDILNSIMGILAKILELTGIGSLAGLALDAAKVTISSLKSMYHAGRALYKKAKGIKGKIRTEAAELFVEDFFSEEDYAVRLIVKTKAYKGVPILKSEGDSVPKLKKLVGDINNHRVTIKGAYVNVDADQLSKIKAKLTKRLFQEMACTTSGQWAHLLGIY
ncbi:MAG: hypothetical protein GY810_29665 [Aureispira sp.]|nr:hypothetical protein [Aureispira sp.]